LQSWDCIPAYDPARYDNKTKRRKKMTNFLLVVAALSSVFVLLMSFGLYLLSKDQAF
jgi:hypothetical protein